MPPEPESPSISGRVVKSTAWVIAWRVVTRNLGLVSTLFLVRLLDPSDFGLVALATAFAMTVDALSTLGVQDALLRHASPTRDLYDTAFGLGLVRGLVTALLIVAGAWEAAAFFKEPRLVIVLIALATGTIVTSFENIGTVDFRRDMTFRKEFNLQVVSRLFGVFLTIGVALIWHNYWALIAGTLGTRFARLCQSYVISRYRPKFSLRAWRGLIHFSLWTWALTMLGQVRDRTDSFVIGRVLTTSDVALFSIGQEVGTLPNSEVVEPLHRTLFSAFVMLRHGNGSPRDLFLNTIEAGFLLILPAGFGISAVADPLVHLLLGERWVACIPIVQIAAAISTISIFRIVCDAHYNAVGELRLTFWLCSVSAFARIPLLLFMVARAGLPGAAWALAISSVIDQMLYMGVTMPRLGVTARDMVRRLWRAIAACLAMTAGLLGAGMAWTPTEASGPLGLTMDLAARSSLGAVLFTAILIVLWFAAGRPDGAERYFLGVMQTQCRRFGILRPAR